MKFTLSWLKDFLDTDASVDAIAEKLTAIGLEVESVEDKGKELAMFTVAEILTAEKHPDADKLQVCKVLAHDGERTVVCGAPNARAGLKVALADLGATIPANGLVIEKRKVRGVESCGMLCSAKELGLGNDEAGIIELPTKAKVGDSIVQVLGLDDVLIDVAITPNRGDCLGVYGIARDLAAAGIGTHKKISQPKLNLSGDAGRAIQLKTEDCRQFVGCLIEGVSNGESPEWLQKKIKSVGLRPISVLVDITNYFTVAYGRPLHVYDADKLNGDIIVRRSEGGEILEALNDKQYELPAGLCVIADEKNLLGLGGVVGGVPSSCTAETKNVFLECAWFEPVAIARTGQSLSIDTDARQRFERTVDPAFVKQGAELAVAMIVELCGGKASELVVAGDAPKLQREISFTTEEVENLGGVKFKADRIQSILTDLGFAVSGQGDSLKAVSPSWRPDMEFAADIVEEILRIDGYQHIPEIPLPPAYAKPDAASISTRNNAMRQALVTRGMKEATHFGFVSEKEASAFLNGLKPVEVQNPISADLDTMRPSLLPGLLAALHKNMNRNFFDLSLFELGTVFHGLTAEQQPLMMAGVRTGKEPVSWSGKPRAHDAFDVKADVFALLEAVGFSSRVQVSREVPAWYHPGKSGKLSLGKNLLGYFGAIHPAIQRAFDLDQEVFAFELYPDAIPAKAGKSREAIRLSDFQPVKRDFAFLVDADMAADDLLGAVRGAEKKLLQEITLFDVYEGKGMPEGKKSLAFSVTLQADDRTLTDEEINKVAQAIIAAAEKQGAQLRA